MNIGDVIRVTPGEGRRVRDPQSLEVIPEAGREIVLDSFWARRLRDGDVVVVAPAAKGKK